MRYVQVPTVSFLGSDGVSRPLKDLREIPTLVVRSVVKKMASEGFDLVACRPDVFGEKREGDTYLLLDANAAEIIESGFDFSSVTSVKVPVIP